MACARPPRLWRRRKAAPFVHAPVECSQAFPQWKARPAIPARDDAAASTASPADVRDDRDTPLSVRRGLGELLEMICPTGRANIFAGTGGQ